VSDTKNYRVGDALEAVGFINPGVFTREMEDALIRPISTKPHADPVAVGPATVLWGNYDSRLVVLTGTLQSHEVTETNQILTLLRDGVLFGASLETSNAPSHWAQFKKGDHVGVTGVCAIQGTQRGAPQSFQVLMRSGSDAVYVASVREFSAVQVLTMLAAAAGAGGVVLLWGVLLRRRVREQTKELANSLSLLNATIESTADGILVVNLKREIRSYNTTFAKAWRLPPELLESKDEQKLLGFVIAQLKDGEAFLGKVQALYSNPEAESFDILEFKDGRVFERFSRPQRLGGICVGRVWSFHDVTARREAEAKFTVVHQQLLETSRRVGMAEVATSVLHNVGNVLNSVNVSATLVAERLGRSRVSNLAHAAELLQQRMDDLEQFLAQDPKGKKLREYLKDLSLNLAKENEVICEEVVSLRRNIEHIKTIVAMQQSYAQVSGTLEKLDPTELMENAIQINGAAFERDRIRLSRNYQPVPQVLADRHKVLQILINLLSNARHALVATVENERCVNLGIFLTSTEHVSLSVSDNGEGIEPQNICRIFTQGYTTRKEGHGFGLHSGASAANEMHGSLSVQSDGRGKGAVFTLELPITKQST
jgi:signal transduction histidine kinase